jgi:hypothetical protein
VEIDVSNAQPLILGFMVAKLLAGDWSLADVKRLGSAGTLSDPFANLPIERWGSEIPADLLDYLDTCQRGEFYEALAEIWELESETPKSRNEIKRLSYRCILFGRVRPGNPRWRAFRERWPSVAAALEEIKSGDQGRSARACQRIESRLMIEGVVGSFERLHPDVPIQTIHDAVLVVPEAVEIAKAAILAEFASVGLVPRVKVSSERSIVSQQSVQPEQTKTGT